MTDSSFCFEISDFSTTISSLTITAGATSKFSSITSSVLYFSWLGYGFDFKHLVPMSNQGYHGNKLRIFLANDDDSIQCLALSRYERLEPVAEPPLFECNFTPMQQAPGREHPDLRFRLGVEVAIGEPGLAVAELDPAVALPIV